MRRCGQAASSINRDLFRISTVWSISYGRSRKLEIGPSGAIRFVITADDFESIDRDAINWFGRHTKDVDRPFLDALAADQGKWIVQQLQARVRKDEKFGIAYSSCRELEEYFETHSESHAGRLPGNDALPDDCKIGPLTFGQYRSAMVTGMARCLKHAAFVNTLLLRKDPPAARDILTIYKFDHELREEGADYTACETTKPISCWR